MASSSSNPYGQPQAQSQPLSKNISSDNIHYSDYHRHSNQAPTAASSSSQDNREIIYQQSISSNPIQQQQHQQNRQQITSTHTRASTFADRGSSADASINQQHMSQDDAIGAQTKSLAHASSLLATTSYDGYIGGMSSDSELTTSGSGIRHSHHYYNHHRPFSSQSRVYYAHPVPRNSPALSSRLSHYPYDPMVVSMQSSSSTSIPNQAAQTAAGSSLPPYQTVVPAPKGSGGCGDQNQASAQHNLVGDVSVGLPITNSSSNQMPSALGHQGSVSSSGSVSSNYLAGIITASESPISPIMMHQQHHQSRPKTVGGRQLPQRPFKQSVSIDPSHSFASSSSGGVARSSHYSGQISDHTSPVHQHHHHQAHLGMSSSRNLIDPSEQQQQPDHYSQQKGYQTPRHLRRELDLMERQTSELSLYDDKEGQTQPQHHHHQPVMGLPPTGIVHRPMSSASGSVRQLPIVGQQQQALIGSMSVDQSQHRVLSEDSYKHPQHHHQHHHHPQLPHQPSDPYTFHRSQHQSITTAHQQQTSSVPSDWLPPMGLSNQHSRQVGQFKQTMSIDQYQSGASRHQHYSPSRTSHLASEQYHSLGSYANSPKQTTLRQQQLIGSHDSPTHSGEQQGYYSPLSSNQDYYQQQIETSGSHQHHHHGANQSDYNLPNRAYDRAAGNSSSAPGSANISQQPSQSAPNPIARAKQIQHQMSDSSSNSNLSGSMKVSQMDGMIERQQAATSTSAASSSSHHHQSPQHKMSSTSGAGVYQHHYGRQDFLRRGYTSVAMTGCYGDLGGSQSALSESGDMSLSQTSHSGGLGSKKHNNLQAASPSLALESFSSQQQHHQAHHSASSSHGAQVGKRSESTTGLPNGSGGNPTLTKKSNSATQLSMSGTKKRLGFRKKQVTSFSVHRSEEVAPLEARHLVKQGSSVSEGDSSMSGDSSTRSWSNSNFKQQTPEELASMSFIDGLGKGQMISRQGLTSPYLGDIQLSLCDRRGNLEIEVIRARNLVAKANKILPLTYVKLYLVKNRKCLAKAKTTLSNKRTLNPLFQQQLTFHDDYRGCILQSIVWGNFGKMDKKNFMGIAQISIDDLELSDTVISWYKLFLPSSLQTLPSKSLRHTLLSNSTESFTNTNNS